MSEHENVKTCRDRPEEKHKGEQNKIMNDSMYASKSFLRWHSFLDILPRPVAAEIQDPQIHSLS